jgi:hypothetical protein
LLQSGENFRDCTALVREHFAIAEPQEPPAELHHPRSSIFVVRDLLWNRVRKAVDFHDQLSADAGEVGDLAIERMLTPEFETLQSTVAE